MARRICDSPFWQPLWQMYARAPSVALCRVPEAEYAAQLCLAGRTLDHCCGDGLFTKLVWPHEVFAAGCDLAAERIKVAQTQGRHEQLETCDAAQRLPYAEASFDLVFNNSALEHIPDLAAALREVARVTHAGGEFAFNVLNHRYFAWWPLDEQSMRDYRAWQPFYHALNSQEWTARLEETGFAVTSVQGYFPKKTAQILARLDFEFSQFFIKKKSSPLVEKYRKRPRLQQWLWRHRLARLPCDCAPEGGAGYFIRARRK